MSQNLKFYKGSYNTSQVYENGAIYFDNVSHEIRIGKGATDSYDIFGSHVKDITDNDDVLIISFTDGRADMSIDFKQFAQADDVTALQVSVANLQALHATGKTVAQEVSDGIAATPHIENTIEDIKVNGVSQAIIDRSVNITVPSVPEYSIIKDASSSDYAAVYHLTKDGTNVGVPINIPKDMVVESGEVRKLNNKEIAAGKGVAGKDYIVLTLANVQPTEEDPFKNKLYILVDGLVDVYTGGETNTISTTVENYVITANLKSSAVAFSHLDSELQAKINGKVDRSVSGTNGTALVFNETDGGGAKFEHNDGTESFVGVNDGGGTGMALQLYVDKEVDGTWKGATIKGYNDKFFYQNYDNRASGKPSDSYEIAVKGDILQPSSTQFDVNDNVFSIKAEVITGGVKVDDVTIKKDSENTLYAAIATSTTRGTVKSSDTIAVDTDGTMFTTWSTYN